MQPLCTNCVKDENLKKIILNTGRKLKKCDICYAQDVFANESDNPALKSRIRALIRYHFSEWHYNSHMGGDSLESLFVADNPITNYQKNWDCEKYEYAILEILEPGYADYDKGISLFSGYNKDAQQNPPLVALKNDSSSQLKSLQRLSKNKNYFFLEKDAKMLLELRIPDIDATLEKGTVLYRSRIGYSKRATPLSGWDDERHYRPYSDSKLTAPPPIIATGGRMNRPGVSFLYLATDTETAIAETRPHPGHYCSFCSFEAIKDIRVADLSSLMVTDFAESDKRLDEYLLLKTLDELFSIPITPEEKAEYHFTQLLADCFRQLGFDAIRYKSSVGTETNYVFFDPEKFCYVPSSSHVVKISTLNYTYETMPLMKENDDYWTDLDGNFI